MCGLLSVPDRAIGGYNYCACAAVGETDDDATATHKKHREREEECTKKQEHKKLNERSSDQHGRQSAGTLRRLSSKARRLQQAI